MMPFFYLAPWIVFFPVIGLLINLSFGRRMGERVVRFGDGHIRAVEVNATPVPPSELKW